MKKVQLIVRTVDRSIVKKKKKENTTLSFATLSSHGALPVALSNPYSGNSDRGGVEWWRRWCETTRRSSREEEEHRRLNAEIWWRFGGHPGAYIERALSLSYSRLSVSTRRGSVSCRRHHRHRRRRSRRGSLPRDSLERRRQYKRRRPRVLQFT